MSMRVRQSLCQVFLEQVDPVIKILHRPSLCSFLLDGKPYLDYALGDPAPTALACAVYYAATCVMDEGQCLVLFEVNKQSVVSKLQKETEAALSRADLVTTNDLTVLQAFVLSLVRFSLHYPRFMEHFADETRSPLDHNLKVDGFGR